MSEILRLGDARRKAGRAPAKPVPKTWVDRATIGAGLAMLITFVKQMPAGTVSANDPSHRIFDLVGQASTIASETGSLDPHETETNNLYDELFGDLSREWMEDEAPAAPMPVTKSIAGDTKDPNGIHTYDNVVAALRRVMVSVKGDNKNNDAGRRQAYAILAGVGDGAKNVRELKTALYDAVVFACETAAARNVH